MCRYRIKKNEESVIKFKSFLIIFLICRNLAEVSFLFSVPDKISMKSLLNSEKKIDLHRAIMKEQKPQDESKNAAHPPERHIKTELVSRNPPKCMKKATSTGAKQLAKSIHATSDNIA